MVDCDCQIEHFGAVVFGRRVGGLGVAAPVALAMAPNEPNLARFRPKDEGREERQGQLGGLNMSNEPNLAVSGAKTRVLRKTKPICRRRVRTAAPRADASGPSCQTNPIRPGGAGRFYIRSSKS